MALSAPESLFWGQLALATVSVYFPKPPPISRAPVARFLLISSIAMVYNSQPMSIRGFLVIRQNDYFGY